MNVLTRFLKLGILGMYVCIYVFNALNKTGQQRQNMLNIIKITPSVLNMFIILLYLPIKYQRHLNKTDKLRIAAFHLLMFCGTRTVRVGSGGMMFSLTFFYSCNNHISTLWLVILYNDLYVVVFFN